MVDTEQIDYNEYHNYEGAYVKWLRTQRCVVSGKRGGIVAWRGIPIRPEYIADVEAGRTKVDVEILASYYKDWHAGRGGEPRLRLPMQDVLVEYLLLPALLLIGGAIGIVIGALANAWQRFTEDDSDDTVVLHFDEISKATWKAKRGDQSEQ